MPNQTIDISIPECQNLKQGWGKVLSYKVDVAIVEDGNTFAKGIHLFTIIITMYKDLLSSNLVNSKV